jgi:hypothetical protein
MQLVNQTPVPCSIQVSEFEGTPYRFGFLTAKATFSADISGRAVLDTQKPFPILDKDKETEFGLLPSDSVPRRDSVFEVIVLGAAHGRGRPSKMVELAVGEHRQQLLVLGDRYWIRHGQPAISQPASVDILPLCWDRAFGGSSECWIDKDSAIDLEHPMNKYGRGFDAEKLARDYGQAFKAPAGFPKLAADYRRGLPNLEDPRCLIRRWEDEPRPYCWATVPTDIGAHMQRVHDHIRTTGKPLSEDEMLRMAYHRAHPDWILPRPKAGAMVTLKGMTKEDAWSFPLPRLRVLADYELGERTGTRELEPHMLVLLAHELRFYIVYRHFFTLQTSSDMNRSFRLRTEEGWIQ